MQVFVSYRRADSGAMAGRLADRVRREPRITSVFFDTEAILAGQAFWKHIEANLKTSAICLVVIGPQWTGERLGSQARIFEDEDYVRLEIRTALEAGVRILPVLVDGASMPRADDLPEDIHGLLALNAVSVRHESFARDADHLIEAILQRRPPTTLERYWAGHPTQWAVMQSVLGAVGAGAALVVALAVLNALSGLALSDLVGGNAGLALVVTALIVAAGAAAPHLLRRR